MKAKTVTSIFLLVLVQCTSIILGAPASTNKAVSVFDRIMVANNNNNNNRIAHPRSKGGVKLFEGDIKVTAELLQDLQNAGITIDAGRRRRAVTNNRDKRWIGDDGRPEVPYRIESSNAHATDVIMQAMRHWTAKVPCIRFVRHTRQNKYLSFRSGDGCWSYVGRQQKNGPQPISIGPGCNKMGIVAHEIGHALGFWHEQSRPDRDKYVKIHWENIRSGMKSNFQKYSFSQINSMNIPYDYLSLMHYGSTAFSKNGRDTISRTDGGTALGNRVGLSDYDARQANLLYRCGNAPQPTNPPTNPSTRPTPGNCPWTDRNVRCPEWKSRGFCDTGRYIYILYMDRNCAKSCKCGSPIPCRDLLTNGSCPFWSRRGYCNRYSTIGRICRKTCRLC